MRKAASSQTTKIFATRENVDIGDRSEKLYLRFVKIEHFLKNLIVVINDILGQLRRDNYKSKTQKELRRKFKVIKKNVVKLKNHFDPAFTHATLHMNIKDISTVKRKEWLRNIKKKLKNFNHVCAKAGYLHHTHYIITRDIEGSLEYVKKNLNYYKKTCTRLLKEISKYKFSCNRP